MICTWEYDETHFEWDTECGEAHQFPASQTTIPFTVCIYCGKPIEVSRSEDDLPDA